jgi:hypothetical protein
MRNRYSVATSAKNAVEIAETKKPAALTAASWLMMSGTPVIEIAKYLAMTEKMVVDTYGHHSPDWLRGAANAIGKPFRRISA